MYRVVTIDRRLADLAEQGRLPELELRAAARELAIACNVLERTPGGRIMVGSEIDRRMRARIDELEHALDELELPGRRLARRPVRACAGLEAQADPPGLQGDRGRQGPPGGRLAPANA